MTQPLLPFGARPDPSRRAPAVPAVDGELVFARHPRARRYVVRVKGDGSVRVTIPRWGTKKEAQAFASTQKDWITKQRTRLLEARQRPVPGLSTDEARRYRVRATEELPARLLALAQQHRLQVSRVSIRNQKWRWGSCSRSGHICLNWRLVAMPDWVRDYVLLHELMHLKRMDHSPRFWKLVEEVCPKFREARRWLRQNQSLLDAHE